MQYPAGYLFVATILSSEAAEVQSHTLLALHSAAHLQLWGGAKGRHEEGLPGAHLPQAPAEVPVAGGHDVAAVLAHALADAVVRVGAGVHAGQALHAGVLHASVLRQMACCISAPFSSLSAEDF